MSFALNANFPEEIIFLKSFLSQVMEISFICYFFQSYLQMFSFYDAEKTECIYILCYVAITHNFACSLFPCILWFVSRHDICWLTLQRYVFLAPLTCDTDVLSQNVALLINVDVGMVTTILP